MKHRWASLALLAASGLLAAQAVRESRRALRAERAHPPRGRHIKVRGVLLLLI
jgi:hypothetical protein